MPTLTLYAKIKYFLFIITIFTFSFSLGISQSTQLSGELNGMLVKGEYEITSDISIPYGQSLIIQAGTVLLFHQDVSLYVSGEIQALGTSTDSIKFTTIDNSIGWSGLKFNPNSSSNSKISFCLVEYSNKSGIEINHCSPAILNSQISHNEFYSDNQTCGGAGGISIIGGSPLIENTEISYNELKYTHSFKEIFFQGSGGLMTSCGGTSTLKNCKIHHNSSDELCNSSGGVGCASNSNLLIINGQINSNKGKYGGGISCQTDGLSIFHSTIANNEASHLGGGIHISVYSPFIVNSIIAHNISDRGNQISYGCSCCSNFTSPNPTIKNCNFGEYDPLAFEYEGSCNNLLQGFLDLNEINVNGEPCDIFGNISSSPNFVDDGNHDYNLQLNSPCIDAGWSAQIQSPFDLQGHCRNWDGNGDGFSLTDMGAYEFSSDQLVQTILQDNLENEFILSPNPTSGLFSIIDINSESPKYTVQIVDINGMILFKSVEESPSQIDLSNLSPGVYFIHIFLSERVYTKRLIKI